MYYWFIVVAAYIVSVVLSVLVFRYANRAYGSPPDVRDFTWSIIPGFNVVCIVFCICITMNDNGLPKWLNRLYGGRG